MTDSGKTDEVKGRVKEAVGSLLDDDELKKEGQIDQIAGKAKQKARALIDRVKNVVAGNESGS